MTVCSEQTCHRNGCQYFTTRRRCWTVTVTQSAYCDLYCDSHVEVVTCGIFSNERITRWCGFWNLINEPTPQKSVLDSRCNVNY